MDGAEIAQGNAGTVNSDPIASEADEKAAQDEDDQAAAMAQRFCDGAGPAS
ncbi:hypothetical protein [Streptomyces sp. NBC_00342]|uniref:hypothetical protein n=1 Tax=Streptomyces sp. NBC_00342 TaxID=2975718 RepID=UPI002E2D531E|nr:hypothetical protein [Streptomyces sp. NBC_00342]